MTKKNKQQEKEISEKSLSNLNRAGRPPGAKNKTTLFKEAMREGFENRLMVDGQKVFDACVQKAIGEIVRDKDGNPVKDENGEVVRASGDTTAMKLIMDRVLPVADVQQGKGSGSGKIVINVQGMGTNIEVMDADDAVDADYEEIE